MTKLIVSIYHFVTKELTFILNHILKGKEASKLCYFNEAGPAGWCGTCLHGDLKPGEEGYCDYYNGKIIYLVNDCTVHI